ncbi:MULTISPECIES: hypothetical protein [Gordonia]|uniref:hypothetical protein n=1 Tax=Gordonia oleivorans TaxID=3156618 RepID=UPI0032B455F7
MTWPGPDPQRDPWARPASPYGPGAYPQPGPSPQPYPQNPYPQNPYAQNPYPQNPYPQNPYAPGPYPPNAAAPQFYPGGLPPAGPPPRRGSGGVWAVVILCVVVVIGAVIGGVVLLSQSGSGGVLASSSSDEQAVRAAYEGYTQALSTYDIEGAKGYICPESTELLGVLDLLGAFAPEGETADVDLDVQSVEIDGDRATVTASIYAPTLNMSDVPGHARRIGDGSWCLLD